MLRARAAVTLIVALSCAATLGVTLAASPSRAAAPPLPSAPATDPTSKPATDPSSAPSTTATTGTTTPIFVIVPNLHGYSVARARRTVHALGLRFVTSSRTGYVTSQDPPARRPVGLGTTISVAVGSRGVVRYVEVPDIRGDSVAAARAAVAGVGLTLSAPPGPGAVATQSPLPNQPARVGSTVSVTLAVVAAPTSTRPRAPLLYWVIGVLGIVVLGAAGGSMAHHRGHRRGEDRRSPVPPAPRVTSRLIADTVHTARGGPGGPTVELRTRERASLTIERIP